MVDKKKITRGQDVTRTKRSTALLERLADDGGKPVRVDTSGADLTLLEALKAAGYAPNLSEVYRKSMREAHARMLKKNKKRLDSV
jgi:hypothetical protein